MLRRYLADSTITLPARRMALVSLRRACLDLGDYAAAREVGANLLELGQRQHDSISLAWATVTTVEEDIRSFRSDAAIQGLARMKGMVDPAKVPDLDFAVHMAYGRLYLLKAEYERAIDQFHAGVESAARTQEPASARVEALRALGYAYLALHDNARAASMLADARESDDGTLRARVRGELHLGSAIVLVVREHFAEAEKEFVQAVRIGRESGVRTVELRALADWSDLALRTQQFVRAERLSREALLVAEHMGDSGAAIIARANLGFALGGQGRVAEALPYIDGVIAHVRKQGENQTLLSVLDEKGRMLQGQGMLKETVDVLREQLKLEREQFTERRSKAVAALQERFERDQNHRRIELLEKQNRLKDAEIRNRELRQVALGLAMLLAVAVGVLVALLYRRARKSNAQLQALNQRLAEHAVRDPLTGLYNRRSFAERMDARARRTHGERRNATQDAVDTFMMLDLDHFKSVNDVHGHAAGDAVLVEVARRLQAAVRDSDIVLRWGGEEFVVYLPGCGAEQAATLALRVLQAVRGSPVETASAHLNVTVSMGMVQLPFAGLAEAACDWQRAMQLADAALYLAKRGGRDRCHHLVAQAGLPHTDLDELARDLGRVVAEGRVMMDVILPSPLPDAGPTRQDSSLPDAVLDAADAGRLQGAH